ncbi:MAG: hypothetical protein HQL56_07630 [Magnetococcales bacterium]|nr:hypothetical protein [Magnetococcales bacterium]
MKSNATLLAMLLGGLSGAVWAESPGLEVAPMLPPMELKVESLTAAPVIDGVLDDWAGVSPRAVGVSPVVEKDVQNRVGKAEVALRVGVFGGRFYLAARWADDAADVQFRPWRWRDGKYVRSENRDDQFVVRFDMGGDYDSCMLAKTSYKVDVWRWSAGRSNAVGLAEDQSHVISLDPLEDASDFQGPKGTVYILKRNDAGEAFYANAKAPAAKAGEEEPGIVMSGSGSGSLVDVQAKGVWKDGYWNLEMSRALNTGNADDVVLGGKPIRGAVGVFNKAGNEHKSVSGTINFVFPK